MATSPAFGGPPTSAPPHTHVPGWTPHCPIWPPRGVCCHLRLKSQAVKLSKTKLWGGLHCTHHLSNTRWPRGAGAPSPPWTISPPWTTSRQVPWPVLLWVCGGRSGHGPRAVPRKLAGGLEPSRRWRSQPGAWGRARSPPGKEERCAAPPAWAERRERSATCFSLFERGSWLS